ncbi:MAG: cation:proton antiporter, partial [Chloroflexota bacterium]
MDELSLLTALSVALVVALAGGMLARAIRLPAIIGYLAAGIAISPFTPGYVADGHAIRQLADLGVIFLMFGIGLHIRLADLLRLKGVVVPGALIRMAAIVGLTFAARSVLELDMREAIALGLTISIASTVVAIRALEERGELDSQPGHIVVGWLIVEDLSTVVILTVLPALSPQQTGGVLLPTLIGLAKAVVFVAIMLTAGGWLVQWILVRIARTGSRELFILATVGAALGIASGAAVLGISVALGAFIAGVAISGSETSHQAAADVLPFRDAFAVLFFVSTGMLLDPAAVVQHVPELLVILAIVVAG